MSTRSYVGIIENGVVKYGYHHSDSYLEGLGFELFEEIKNSCDTHKLEDYAEQPFQETSEKDFFDNCYRDNFIEFCYGFNIDEKTWYVSSRHFTDAKQVHKLTEVVQNDIEMNSYASMYYEQYRESIIKEIRERIK